MKQQDKKSTDQKNPVESIGQDTQGDGAVIDSVEEWRQKYIRALADYQNLEKRQAVREDDIRKFAAEITLKKLLPAVDNLILAAHHLNNDGLRFALKEFLSALESVGVQQMNTAGKAFDPYAMECIDVVSGEDGVVVEEVSPGYMFFDKVLRVAKVKVGKKRE